MMEFSKKALVKENESLYSFLYRTFQINHHNRIGGLLTSASLRNNFFKEEAAGSNLIIELIKQNGSGKTVEQLSLNQYDDLFVKNKTFSKEIGRTHIYRRTRTTYCPDCLRNDYYHRLIWDISIVTMCLKHSVGLIESCPKCHKGIRIANLMERACNCGYKYEEAESIKANEMSQHAAAQGVIQSLILDKSETVEVEQGVELSKSQYFGLLFMFCFIVNDLEIKELSPDLYKDGMDRFIFKVGQGNRRNLEMMNTILTTAHRLVLKPRTYFPRLVGVFESPSQLWEKHSGKFHMLAKNQSTRVYREIFKNVSNDSRGSHLRNLVLIEENEMLKDYVSYNKALLILKTDGRRLSELEKYGLIKAFHDKQTGISRYEKGSLLNYQKMRNESVQLSYVERQLGVTFLTATKFIKSGLIKASHGPEIDGYPIWHIALSELEKFKNKLFKHSVTFKSCPEEYITYDETIRKVSRRGISSIDVIIMVMKNQLKSGVIANNVWLNGLFISKEDINTLIRTLDGGR